MKQINQYITEKLRIDKDTNKYTLSDNANILLSWFDNYPKEGKNTIKEWFKDYNVNLFKIYISDNNFINLKKHEPKYKNFPAQLILVTGLKTIIDMSNTYFPELADDKNFSNAFDEKYQLYKNPEEGKEKLDIWGNEYGLLIDTYYYEILVSREEE